MAAAIVLLTATILQQNRSDIATDAELCKHSEFCSAYVGDLAGGRDPLYDDARMSNGQSCWNEIGATLSRERNR